MPDSIGYSGIKILKIHIGTNHFESKSFAEFAKNLPVGASINGQVTSINKLKEAVIYTPYGYVAITNALALKKHDKVLIRVNPPNNKKNVSDVNIGKGISVDNGQMNLLFIKKPIQAKETNLTRANSSAVNLNSVSTFLENKPQIEGSLSYINLSNMAKNSPFLQALVGLSIKSKIKMQIHNSKLDKVSMPFGFVGYVVDDGIGDDGAKNIKAPFGIIQSKDLIDELDIKTGTKLNLELIEIEGKKLQNPLISKLSNLYQSFIQQKAEIISFLQLIAPSSGLSNTDELKFPVGILAQFLEIKEFILFARQNEMSELSADGSGRELTLQILLKINDYLSPLAIKLSDSAKQNNFCKTFEFDLPLPNSGTLHVAAILVISIKTKQIISFHLHLVSSSQLVEKLQMEVENIFNNFLSRNMISGSVNFYNNKSYEQRNIRI